MRQQSIKSAVLILMVASTIACSNAELSPIVHTAESVEQGIWLFNRILAKSDEAGNYSFVEDKAVNLPIIEELFVEKNQLLNKVDEFGFYKDDSGFWHFFVKEVQDEKSISIFVPMSELEGSAIAMRSESGTLWVPGIRCENDHCCSLCVVNNVTCVCNLIDPNCFGDPNPPRCSTHASGVDY